MRVALVAPYDLAVPGGVQAQVLGLARALSAAGDDVLVVAPGDPSGWPLGDPPGRTRLATAGAGPTVVVPVNGSRAPVARSPLAGTRARAAIAAFAPDVVHVHEPFVPGPALAAARAGLAPVVGTFHRAGTDPVYRLAGPLLSPLARRLAVRVAVSEAARATLESVVGALWAGVEILPNAVDLARAERARADPFPSPPTGPTVVFVGRHERRKGLEVLLEAFGRLGAGANLWVVGDGPMRRELEARHGGERVRFLGRLGDDETARRVAGADVLVAPSLGGESFGVVLLEAMAAGTAVLAADLTGYRLAGGDAARYVAPGDPRALAAALGALLGDPSAQARLVDAGLARAADHGFEALAGRYRLRYQACSSRPGRAGP